MTISCVNDLVMVGVGAVALLVGRVCQRAHDDIERDEYITELRAQLARVQVYGHFDTARPFSLGDLDELTASDENLPA